VAIPLAEVVPTRPGYIAAAPPVLQNSEGPVCRCDILPWRRVSTLFNFTAPKAEINMSYDIALGRAWVEMGRL